MSADVDILGWEQRGLNAWPALRSEVVGNWVLRASDGYTKRANSANALCDSRASSGNAGEAPKLDFRDVVTEAERFYAANRQPTVFRITPLAKPEADAVLAAAGYEFLDSCKTMIAPLDGAQTSAGIQIDLQPSPAWLDAAAATKGIDLNRRTAHDLIIQSVRRPAAFATATLAGAPAGFGLAVLERGAIGLFEIAVQPEYRSRGLGRELTRALMGWGQSQGATAAYLQVLDANRPAIKLYESLGFRAAYSYHYRRRAA
jgi:ribosomal protein S18 acetylase RimI-like enzyme